MTLEEAWAPYTAALAPMAGVTDRSFRTVCRSFGPVYTVSEMVSAKALCHNNRKTEPLLRLGDDEHPAAVQIFGSEPCSMVEGAQRALRVSDAAVLDINMGCPTPKIVSNGDGSALMRDIPHAVSVARAVVQAVSVPVTVKMRLGWDSGSKNAVELAKGLEEAGVAGLSVHGRTKTQMYSGRADWEEIAAVVRAVSIPVIANGDIFTPRDAVRCREMTGARMVMAGRAVFGRPWLPAQMDAALRGKSPIPSPPPTERMDIAYRQYRLMEADKGERMAVLEMRRHLAWYLRGFRDNHVWRQRVMEMKTAADTAETIRRLKHWIEQNRIEADD